MPNPRTSALLVTLAVPLTGCYALGEVGYVNSAAVQGPGGASLVVRGGSGDPRGSSALMGIDLDLRGDASTSGSRFAFGSTAMIGTQPGWKHDWTPMLRPAVWLSPARWGPAHEASAWSTSLDLGALLLDSQATHDRGITTLGARVEYAHHPDGFAPSLLFGVFVGTGPSHSFNCCS